MTLAKCALCLVVICCASARASVADCTNGVDRNFDDYGLIRWGDEQAHLDNFAIQLMNEPEAIGYILVYDGEDVCEGEAKARAIRAQKFVVEYRQVPWDRVMWRYEGYLGNFQIALQPAPRTAHFEYPFRGPLKDQAVRHVADHCTVRLRKIENSKPGQP